MMEKAFLDHFKISEDEVQRYMSENTLVLPLIEVLIDKKRIEESEYLTWAKNHYGLPILKESFFEQHNQVQQLLGRYRNVFPKNVIPFYEWDGVIYVMCLEPVVFDAPQKIQYILAPLALIHKWQPQASIEKSELTLTTPTTILAPEESTKTESLAPAGFDSLPSLKPTMPDSIPSSPNDILSFEEPKIEEPTTEAPSDTPEGLSFPSTPVEVKPDYVVDTSIKALDLESFKSTEGETKIVLPPTMEASQPAPASLPNFTPPAPAPTPAQIPQPVEPAAVQTVAPQLAKVDQAQDVSEMTHTGVIIQNDGATGIINSMKKYFDQAMILIFQNGTLKALKWDGGWKKAAHAQAAIDLKSASIFRIVFDTKFPYHGHVIPNPINDAFFHGWNQGQYPQHLTIVPIIDNKNIVGMLLGTCTKQAAQKFQIRHIESIAQDCLTKVIQDQLKKAS